jgi:hypothetical protein
MYRFFRALSAGIMVVTHSAYDKKGGSTMTQTEQGARWRFSRVLDYVIRVENAYGVSLKFWIKFKPGAGGRSDLFVYAAGSGSIFDLLPDAMGVSYAEVMEDEENNLGEALYYAVLHLEQRFNKIREPLGPRPSL